MGGITLALCTSQGYGGKTNAVVRLYNSSYLLTLPGEQLEFSKQNDADKGEECVFVLSRSFVKSLLFLTQLLIIS